MVRVFLLILLFTLSSAFSAEKPNIIFIMADDMGYADLGCYGQKKILTPNIDAMAGEGMRFTQCYAGSTVCAPTRSVLMTGQHTGHTTVRGNYGWHGPEGGRKPGNVSIRDEDVTVAEILKEAGYATGVTGKWGLGDSGTEGVPMKQGFDEWLGFLNQRHAHGFYPEFIWRNDEMVELKKNLGGGEKDWIHDQFTDFSLDFIRDHAEEPFFLYAAYTVPHGRYEIPDYRPYADESWSDDLKGYAAMITRLDADVGKILDLLQHLKIDRKTIVFLTSDNGAEIYYFRPKGLLEEYETTFASPGPFRGWKRDLTDGGIRVPMVVRWPGMVEAGAVNDHPWAFWDFLPTAAELAGVEVKTDIDGISVLPTLRGGEQERHEFLYWEFHEGKGMSQAVRYGDYKAIRSEPDAELALYDIIADTKEMDDIASDNLGVVAKIEEYLETARTPSEHWPK